METILKAVQFLEELLPFVLREGGQHRIQVGGVRYGQDNEVRVIFRELTDLVDDCTHILSTAPPHAAAVDTVVTCIRPPCLRDDRPDVKAPDTIPPLIVHIFILVIALSVRGMRFLVTTADPELWVPGTLICQSVCSPR